jgi:hypothetical protein
MSKYFLFFAALILFVGCAAKQKDPTGVTYDFWMAQKEHDLKKASALSLKNDPDDVKIHSKIDIDRIAYGEPKIHGEEADVPTTLYLKDFTPGSDAEAKVPFDTKLRKTENGWKVDTFETKKALYLAAGKAYAQNLPTAFAQSIKNFLGDRKEIEGVFKELLQGIKKAIDQSPKSN